MSEYQRRTLSPLLPSLLVLSLLVPSAAAATSPILQRRTSPPPKETCEEHVRVTRHTFLEGALLTGDRDYHEVLMDTYIRLGNEKMVSKLCTAPKFLVWYDLDLARVELQYRYDILEVLHEADVPAKKDTQ